MSYINQFSIPIKDNERGIRTFDFYIDNDFFKFFDNNEIQASDLNVIAVSEKNLNDILLRIDIRGDVNVKCDRCLEYFDMPLKFDKNFVIQRGLETNQQSDDILKISEDANELNIGKLLYDYIILSLPIKKVHPDDENGNSLCNGDIIDFLKDNEREQEKIRTDKIWNELKKLKNGTS